MFSKVRVGIFLSSQHLLLLKDTFPRVEIDVEKTLDHLKVFWSDMNARQQRLTSFIHNWKAGKRKYIVKIFIHV